MDHNISLYEEYRPVLDETIVHFSIYHHSQAYRSILTDKSNILAPLSDVSTNKPRHLSNEPFQSQKPMFPILIAREGKIVRRVFCLCTPRKLMMPPVAWWLSFKIRIWANLSDLFCFFLVRMIPKNYNACSKQRVFSYRYNLGRL